MTKELTLAMELVRRLNKLVKGEGRKHALPVVERLLELHIEVDDPALDADEEPLVLSEEGLGPLGLINGILLADGVTNIRVASCFDTGGKLTGFGLWVDGKFVEGSNNG